MGASKKGTIWGNEEEQWSQCWQWGGGYQQGKKKQTAKGGDSHRLKCEISEGGPKSAGDLAQLVRS